MKVNHELASSGLKASSVQESHSQWQSANGSSIHQSSTYCYSSTSSSLPSSILKRPSFPYNSLSASGLQANVPHQLTETTSSPLLASKDSPYPSSQVHSSVDVVCSSSPKVASPLPSKRLTAWSVVPISITTHLLSPSPKPLSSPLHGSSSTLYNVNNPCSQMSSSGNLLTSDTRSPLPTRLSVLTAILKSGSSPKRPFSPVSCSATLSPSSLGSSTLTIDQKLKTTPPTPKKSSSSFSVRSGSPNQDGFHLSVFSNVPDHASLSSKSSPNLGTRSQSPKRHLDTRALSPDKLRPLSPRISSYRKTTVSPLFQPKSPNFSLPPHGPRKGALSPANGTRGPEKSKKIRTYSPTFTAKSIPVSMPVLNQKDRVSPTSEKGCLSPNLMHSSNSRSKGRLRRVSAKDADAYFSVPSPCQPFSQTGPASPTPPVCSIKPSSPQPNSSSIYSNFRACPPSSRPRTPTVTQPRSPTMVHSPYSLSSRSRESISPLSFSLPSDSTIPKVLCLLDGSLACFCSFILFPIPS
ncbi:muscular LMNA-interacting protein-like [Sceloporus undulatus]|uniref:muscular LMNA-interacting protein-like n=1 Tax=Sceloporus undulatus TaxID=8520 RepID=UPI001C4C7E53|nr:muscular LMNA-interacting protein-like [Sceloporus undulatus]